MTQKINLGIVGAAGKRASNLNGFSEDDRVDITAVCDLPGEGLQQVADELNVEHAVTDYDELLTLPDLDAVYICTPDQLHAAQSRKALERDIHVLCEVPAALTLDEAKELVSVANDSDAIYMMNEETIYFTRMREIENMVKSGLFGDLYYAEGEYIHNVIDYMKKDSEPWRRQRHLDRNGVTYPTHALGPILLLWMHDDRIDRLSCSGSGHHYTDEEGKEYLTEDTTSFFAKTERGRQIRIRQDFISNRPPGGSSDRLQNYQLQGTEGCYEGARSPIEPEKIWLASRSEDMKTWSTIDQFEDEFMPDYLKNPPAEVDEQMHAGTDYFIRQDFVNAILENAVNPVGIHESMDLSLPGIVSVESINNDSEWVKVPDSRQW